MKKARKKTKQKKYVSRHYFVQVLRIYIYIYIYMKSK